MNSQQMECVIAEITRQLLGIQGIYVFGSMSSGQERFDSDVDIAVLGDIVFLFFTHALMKKGDTFCLISLRGGQF